MPSSKDERKTDPQCSLRALHATVVNELQTIKNILTFDPWELTCKLT